MDNQQKQSQPISRNSTIENIFLRYDYLCQRYAKKIWGTDTNPAYEKDDILQELRIRLFTSINTYLERYEEFKKTGKEKPMPLEFYLRTSMINRTKDLIKEISRGSVNFSLDESGLQVGSNAQNISADNYNITIGSQNLLDLFDPEDRLIMKVFFLKDFNKKATVKAIKKNSKGFVSDTIDDGVEIIRNFLTDNAEPVEEFSYYQLES